MQLFRFAFLLFVLVLPAPGAGQSLLPMPEGGHAVGYWSGDLPTGQEDDLSESASETRTLQLEAWYPAFPDDGGHVKPLFSPAMQASLSRQFPFPDGFAEDSYAHALVGLRPLERQHPVVILSPGLSFPIGLYQSFAEELASRGYIVIGTNHPHGTVLVEYEDGTSLANNAWPQIENEGERQLFLANHAAVWEQDLLNVLAWVRAGASGSPFAGQLDLVRIGGLGHSYGGTAIGRLAARGELQAAVVMEGAVRDPDAEDARGQLTSLAPLMHIIGGYNRLEHEGDQYRPSAEGPVYQVIINGTGHAELSDLIHLYGYFAGEQWWQRRRYAVPPDRVLQIAQDHAVAMFDQWLRDEETSVLLRPRSLADRVDSPRNAGYPEVELQIAVEGP